MTVDRKAVDDMANIMALLNGKGPVAPTEPYALLDESNFADASMLPESQPAPIARSVIGDPNIDAMKDILLRLQEASEVAAVKADRIPDPELQQAMVTERTKKGVRIGNWEVVIHENAKGRTYDIVSRDETITLAKGLYLYDAAVGIAQKLNNGQTINAPQVRSLLKLEEDYAKKVDDAVVYKARAKKLREQGDEFKAAVAEDRFDASKRDAEIVLDDILKLAGVLR